MPNAGDILKANKMIRRLKASDDVCLRFEPIREGAQSTLIVDTDAALLNAPLGEEPRIASQGGHIVVEVETASGELRRTPRFNVLSWSSKKLSRVCRSSFAAECLAACNAGDEGCLAKYMWRELTRDTRCFMVTDSLNLRDHISSISNNVTEKRLKVDLFALKQVFQRYDIDGLIWIDATENPADALTKSSRNLSRVLRERALDISTLT